MAQINGRRVSGYVYQNGAKLDDAAGQGHGVADVFDNAGHLTRRFIFRENLNSPALFIEFFTCPEALNEIVLTFHALRIGGSVLSPWIKWRTARANSS